MQLFIEDINIQLIPGEFIILNQKGAEIGNPGGRSGSFTNDFKAILNPHNKSAIGFVDSLQAANSFRVEKKHEAKLFNEAGGEIARGFTQIVSINKRLKTITITFYTGNTPWIDLLKGKSIRDIWLWDLQHDYTEANIVASWSNTGGYIYPFIDYGRLTFLLGAYTYVDDWFPAMYQHSLVTRMMEAIGWKISGDIVDSWNYNHAVIPFVNERFLEDSEFQVPASAERTTLVDYGLSRIPVSATTETLTEVLDIDTVIVDELGAFNLSTDRYVATKGLNDAIFTLTLSNTSLSISIAQGGAATGTIKLQLRKNGVAVEEQTLLTLSGNGLATLNGPFVITTTTDMIAGDYIDGAIETSYSGAVISTTIISIVTGVNDYNFDLSNVDNTIIPGNNVTLHNNLPDIDQAKFIKDIIIRHGALVTVDQYTSTITLNSMEKVLDQSEDLEDWSDRVNLLSTSEIDFTKIVNRYGKKSYFKYADAKDDDSYLTEYNDGRELALGDGKLEIDNDFIQDTTDIYTSIFTPTLTIEAIIFPPLSVSYFLPYIPRVSYDGSESLQANPRILLVIPNTDVADFAPNASSVEIDGTGYTETAFAFFAKPLLNSDLDHINESLAYDTPSDLNNIDEGLLAKNYATWLKILQSPRYVTLGLKLWEYQFKNVDLSQLIQIRTDEIQGYFIIDEIDFSKQGDRVRLIQVK